jgi:hypothetical protein
MKTQGVQKETTTFEGSVHIDKYINGNYEIKYAESKRKPLSKKVIYAIVGFAIIAVSSIIIYAVQNNKPKLLTTTEIIKK